MELPLDGVAFQHLKSQLSNGEFRKLATEE